MAHTPVETVHIHLGDRSYPILIGAGLLSAPSTWADMPKGSSALIVTNTTVAPLYAAAVQAALAPHFAQVHVLALPDGEAHKGWEVLNQIFDLLLAVW